ncbi:glycosyltransferase [Candidatus Daviesbacteria bacterium]|nr:glycosyltransferase [Candidatus Daviesbacteria bacterium]
MKNSLVSVIIATKNEEKNIERCLKSIKKQNYIGNIEVIVVDNYSADQTIKIAKKYTRNVFLFGPERSAQRNLGAKKARGEWLLFLDADMEASANLISECS